MISATAGGSSRLVNIFRDHTVFEISKQFVILHLSVSSDMLLSARISDNIDKNIVNSLTHHSPSYINFITLLNHT